MCVPLACLNKTLLYCDNYSTLRNLLTALIFYKSPLKVDNIENTRFIDTFDSYRRMYKTRYQSSRIWILTGPPAHSVGEPY